jgi:hypothetical protein
VLGFVTSLPHPVNCASYDRRCELLGDTLHSVLAQTDPDITVVVVANEPPVGGHLPDDPRVEVVLVDFPPPHKPEGTPVITDAMYADKGGKLSVGTAAARRSGADYIMWVDSDDFVSDRIAAFVRSADGAPGWYSDAGFFHVQGSRTVTPVEHDFHQRNGSTHVLRADLTGVPETIEPTLTRNEVIDAVGRKRVRSIMGDHKWIVAFYEELGTPLAPMPFPAAIWEIGTGENFSRILTAAGSTRPVAGAIAAEYGLPLPSHADALRSRLAGARARVARRLSARHESLEDLRARIQEPGAATPDADPADEPSRD